MNIVKDYDEKNERDVKSTNRSVFFPFARNAGKRIAARRRYGRRPQSRLQKVVWIVLSVLPSMDGGRS